jgi:uncharacterized protein YodC (DUF2158 family)
VKEEEMAKHSFKLGDIVQLKSGGPSMTVYEVDNDFGKPVVRCQWFAGKKLESGTFAVESIQPVP